MSGAPAAWCNLISTQELLAKMRIRPARPSWYPTPDQSQDEGRIESLASPDLPNGKACAFTRTASSERKPGFVNMKATAERNRQYYDASSKALRKISLPWMRAGAHSAPGGSSGCSGHSFVSAMDKRIQYITERELAAGARVRRGGRIAVVMETATGRIWPWRAILSFNCTLQRICLGRHRNRRFPISSTRITFKVVVAAAAWMQD